MEQTLKFIYMGALLASAVTAIIYRRRLAAWNLSIMTFYLPLVFIMEVYTGSLLSKGVPTAPIYNIYRPVTVLVFAIMYYSLPPMVRFRKWIIGIIILYLLAVPITYFYFDSFNNSNTYLTLARGICITFFGIFFLMSFLLLDNTTQEKFWRPVIWVTIGVLIFYPVISIALGLEELLRNSGATIGGLKLYQAIPRLMSIFMYSCFSYAFYICKTKS